MDLLILSLAVAGFVANVETAILFVRRKAITTMGGYLAHIGMSIMLVGILVSGVYEKKTTVNLLRDQPMTVGKNTLTFTRLVFVTDSGEVKRFEELNALSLADRRAKQAMEVEVTSPGGGVWKAYPEALHEHAHEPDDGEPRREVLGAHGPLRLAAGLRPRASPRASRARR